MNRDEIKRISQMRELNQQKILQLEEQISKLDQIVQEHETVYRSLLHLSNSNNQNYGMMPIGAGVQIPINYKDIKSTIIDLGSGIHAERSLKDSIEILDKRMNELKSLIEQLVKEHDTTSNTIKEIDLNINKEVEKLENNKQDPPRSSKPKKKQRRRYGGELTLDD